MAGPYLTNPLEQINASWQQGRTNAFNDAEGRALTTTGVDQQSALTQAAQLNPQGSLDMTQKNTQVNGQKLVNMARLLINAPDTQKDAIYQSLKPTLGAVGLDPSTLPANYDDSVAKTAQSLVSAYTPTNQIPAAVRTDMYRNQGLTDEEINQKRHIQAGLQARATADNWQTKDVPDGMGGTTTLVHNARTNKWETPDFSSVQAGSTDYSNPPSAAGGNASSAPSAAGAGWQTTMAQPDAAAIANGVLDQGGTLDQAGAEVQRRVGPNQATDIHMNPQTGRFENVPTPAGATPTRLDAQGNEMAPAAASAPAAPAPAPTAGLGLGHSAPKQDTNEIVKREANWQHFINAGIPLTEDQHKKYLLDGKPPEQADKPLSADQETIARSLANYSFGASGKFFGDTKNQAIIARTIALNPDWQQGNYALNNKYLSDLQSNSPTSTGGGVVAANTALSHLQAMSDLSQKLPDYTTDLIGKPMAILASHGSGQTGNDLKSWDTASQLMAAEVQKMIKSGVATEGETKAMLANLSPGSPRSQRDVALARLAEFMNDKVAAQETKRDQVLGEASPGTSLLNAPSQQKLTTVLQRGNIDVPTLRAPSQTLRAATSPAEPKSAQASSASSVTPSAANYLRAHPELRAQFDQKYGQGASNSILGN